MYKIFASKSSSGVAPNYKALVPFEYRSMDDAAKKCMELFRKGNTIHKVVLPSGSEIYGHQIETALRKGMDSVRAAIAQRS